MIHQTRDIIRASLLINIYPLLFRFDTFAIAITHLPPKCVTMTLLVEFNECLTVLFSILGSAKFSNLKLELIDKKYTVFRR